MKRTLLMGIIVLSLSLLAINVIADSHLPIGILKAQEYNNELAGDIFKNVSFFIAFLAGITTILSPCVLPLLPAYFAITFKERKKITLATSMFFIGFSIIFVIMGLLATLTGKTLITVFDSIDWIVPIAGALLIFFGIMIFLGKGFAGLSVGKKMESNWKGLLASGGLFAIGWTACIGPILSGVLLMVATFNNYGTAVGLMLFYSLGVFVPLFILSFFYNKLHLERIKFLKKKMTIKIGKKEFYTTYPNLIAGIMFVLLGIIFIVFRGTWIVNGFNMFGLRQYFYNWQNIFLENSGTFNIVGFILFAVFVTLLGHFIYKELRNAGDK
jgi:cytochrome c-type biogenesis protein